MFMYIYICFTTVKYPILAPKKLKPPDFFIHIPPPQHHLQWQWASLLQTHAEQMRANKNENLSSQALKGISLSSYSKG